MGVRLMGIDPGLRCTGWGIIEIEGNRLSHIGSGAIKPDSADPLPVRLTQLFDRLCEVITSYCPSEAAVEETFVNKNPSSTLKLGQARGVVLLAPAKSDVPVAEYAANLVKKSLVGTGHANKLQVKTMVQILLPGSKPETTDASDALAIAICHAHHRQFAAKVASAHLERIEL
ncbi:MAG: crossover junction endodeoxyribonuclease RuvC [Pseudomonadota bacterium]|nr:crossover junction endodeoxyribonuclease RuvC [Pseudomonadota bacterium]